MQLNKRKSFIGGCPKSRIRGYLSSFTLKFPKSKLLNINTLLF